MPKATTEAEEKRARRLKFMSLVIPFIDKITEVKGVEDRRIIAKPYIRVERTLKDFEGFTFTTSLAPIELGYNFVTATFGGEAVLRFTYTNKIEEGEFATFSDKPEWQSRLIQLRWKWRIVKSKKKK